MKIQYSIPIILYFIPGCIVSLIFLLVKNAPFSALLITGLVLISTTVYFLTAFYLTRKIKKGDEKPLLVPLLLYFIIPILVSLLAVFLSDRSLPLYIIVALVFLFFTNIYFFGIFFIIHDLKTMILKSNSNSQSIRTDKNSL